MEFPKQTPIPVHLHKRLAKVNKDMMAIQQMMQMFQQSCQQRLAEAQEEARQAWEQVALDTGIDMRNVAWDIHPTDPAVVPTQMKLLNG